MKGRQRRGEERRGGKGREGKRGECLSERGFKNTSPLSICQFFSGNCFQIVRVLTWGLESLECFFLETF